MKDLRAERIRAQKSIAVCQRRLDQCPNAPPLPKLSADIDPYVIEVDFEALKDPERRDYFHSPPTSFSLTDEQVEKLIEVGPELLRDSLSYQEFLQSLAAP